MKKKYSLLVWAGVLFITVITMAMGSVSAKSYDSSLSAIKKSPPQSKADRDKDEVEKSRLLYSAAVGKWNRKPTKSPSTQDKTKATEMMRNLDKQLSQTASVEKKEQLDDNASAHDVGYYKDLINDLINENEIEMAYDYATLLLQMNPNDNDIKRQFAEVYQRYAETVVKKRNEIIQGGTQ